MFMYDEMDIATTLYHKGFTEGYRYGEALRVAKYMRHILGYGNARIKTELLKFCEEHDPYFRPVPNRLGISKVISDSRRDFTSTSSQIVITKSEIEAIQRVKVFKHQRTMLAVLLLVKLKKTDKIWLSNWTQIRKIINKNITNKVISVCFNLYYEQGLVGVSHSAHTLLFIEDSNKDGVITIHNDSDVRNLMLYYETYCGGVIKYCANCGNEIGVHSNSHRYCEECRNIKTLEKHKRYNKKRNDQ